MQRRKNIRLLAILSLLVVTLVGIQFYQPENQTKSNLPFESIDFSAVDQIIFERKGHSVTLRKEDGNWTVGKDKDADNQLVDFFLQVMARVKVRRQVPRSLLTETLNNLASSGVNVQFKAGNVLKGQMQVLGNSETKETFFFREGDVPVEVHVPGYSSYVGSLFQLTENQWRNKVIFSSNERTMKSLEIKDVSSEETVEITDHSGFPGVAQVDELDTTRLMDFIATFNYYEVDGYIKRGEYPRFDSLYEHEVPILEVRIDDIDDSFDNSLMVFPLIPNDRFYFGIIKNGEWVVIEKSKIQALFVSNEDFRLQE